MTKPPRKPSTSERRGVQSAEVALRVADAVAAKPRAQNLKDIAAHAGLDASATHRYLASLMRSGLVVQDETNGLYDLGPFALRLGYSAIARQQPLQVAERALEAYVAATGETAMLSVWTERGPMVLRWQQGARPVYSTIAVGSVMPLGGSATGFAFLAHLPRAATRALLEREDPADRRAALAAAERARRLGFATIANRLIPGLSAIACPIKDRSGAVAAVMTAVATSRRFTPGDITTLKSHARAAALSLGSERN
jgi:DNA-binding IclR family transcriptional regulator